MYDITLAYIKIDRSLALVEQKLVVDDLIFV